MVFTNEKWNGTRDIVIYSNYHKYWLDRERKIKNPLFDVFSGKILDLKEGKEDAIRYFYKLLDEEICRDVTVCVVPSSDARNLESGISQLAKRLAKNGRIDKVHYLMRSKSIDKLAYGGARDVQVHLNSIVADEKMTIEGDVILLVDDVTTTGNSLYACKDLLMQKGASSVEMFAIGKAI